MRAELGRLAGPLVAGLILLTASPSVRAQPNPADQASLFAQSIEAVLARSAVVRTTPALEFLVLDIRTGEPLASTFADLDAPIPVGSLLKPFLVHALPADAPPFTVRCRGATDRCWKRGGHGVLRFPDDLAEALAQSCNAFFLALAGSLGPARLDRLEGLPAPPRDAPAKTLIGLTGDWPIAPLTLARGYRALLSGAPGPGRGAVLRGMLGAAEHGTARGLGRHPGGVLAKTGTAPCLEAAASSSMAHPVARCLASGDGLVVAAVPAEHPKLLLLVRQRGTTGAHAALAAGSLLRVLEAHHAS